MWKCVAPKMSQGIDEKNIARAVPEKKKGVGLLRLVSPSTSGALHSLESLRADNPLRNLMQVFWVHPPCTPRFNVGVDAQTQRTWIQQATVNPLSNIDFVVKGE